MLSSNIHKQLFAEIWHDLLLTCNPGQSPRMFMQVSTVYENQAFSRMVVLRACEIQRRTLSFYTDHRSKKVQHLKQNPQMACLFYKSSEKTQLRLMTRVQLNHKNALCQEHWSGLRPNSKLNYARKLTPGSILSGNKNTHESLDPDVFNLDLAYENFVVVSSKVHEIEYLNLKEPQHQRVKFEFTQGSWMAYEIAP